MLHKNIIIITLLLLLFPSYGYCDKIDELASRFDVDRDSAEQIVTGIFSVARGIQSGISQVADSHIAESEKIGDGNIIEKLLEEYFESDSSKIYVSSLNRNDSVSFSARDYLRRLATLSKTHNYSEIKIYYDDKIRLTEMSSDNDRVYTTSVHDKMINSLI